MIYDFKELSNQYLTEDTTYSFDMQPEHNYTSFNDINELIIYLQKNNVEDILISIIKERYPNCFIDRMIIQSMIDYYIECLSI